MTDPMLHNRIASMLTFYARQYEKGNLKVRDYLAAVRLAMQMLDHIKGDNK